VSNPVLLQILSQGSDPLAILQYYEKIFDSISYVEHDKKDKFTILAMISREGTAEEKIPFRKPVKVSGNIEDWLMDVLKEMQRTMKVKVEEAVGEVMLASQDLSQLRKFVDNSCAQYALLGLQLMWTNDCEQALLVCKKDKVALKAANKKTLDILSMMSAWCLTDLGSKMNRTKIETLITIHVHSRDVINDIYNLWRNKKISGVDDFMWQSQLRIYWEPDGHDFLDENGACRIRITDVPFDYQFEYLGCKERLCITPLTDRASQTRLRRARTLKNAQPYNPPPPPPPSPSLPAPLSIACPPTPPPRRRNRLLRDARAGAFYVLWRRARRPCRHGQDRDRERSRSCARYFRRRHVSQLLPTCGVCPLAA
jgi:dynein heavy chain